MSYTLTYGQGGLADAAKYLSSKGRGEDTQLIHMTPGEINTLQSMAEQHGGSLTINPHTGLPEAGWLGNILKTAAMAGATYFGGPALGAALAPGASVALQTGLGMGLVSGGLTTLATGSLKKGLGAGLTTGLIGGMMTPSTPAPTADVVTQTPALTAANLNTANTGLAAPGTFNPALSSSAPQTLSGMNTQLNVAGTFNPALQSSSNVLSQAAPVAVPPPATTAQAASSGPFSKISNYVDSLKLTNKEKLGYGIAGVAGLGILGDALAPKFKPADIDKGSIRPYTYASTIAQPSPYPTGPMYDVSGNPILANREQRYFNQGYTELPAYKAAAGGLMAAGGLSNMYPQSQQYSNDYASSIQAPMGNEVLDSGYEQRVGQYTGEPIGYAGGGTAEPENSNKYTYDPSTQRYTEAPQVIPEETNQGNSIGLFNILNRQNKLNEQNNNQGIGSMGGNVYSNMFAGGLFGNRNINSVNNAPTQPSYTYDPVTQQYKQMANGGMANLGDYSDGGRLLKGPGDGVSDSIPASIGGKQPARLADGEFVIPARIVSELGNGSTDAGAKRLYAMMDRVQSGRKKTVGKGKVAVDSKAAKHLPR
jgi:hypothetical protein